MTDSILISQMIYQASVGTGLLVFTIIGLILALAYERSKRGKNSRQKVAPRPVHTLATQGDSGQSKEFAGKVAIITGGGTGLGRSIALSLASKGAKVVIASRNVEHLDKTAAEIKALGGEVMTHSFDVRNPEQVDAMVNAVLQRWGQIDILVNNAAGNFVIPAEELTPNGWNAVIGIVLNGTWYCTSAVGKHMISRGQGSILNIVANYAWSGYPGVVHSAAAKAGVLNMTRTLAVEWGYKGLRINALAPGTMPSQAASKNLKFAAEWVQKKIRAAVPLGRLTDADEMAELGVFLLSDQAAYINGEVLTADGGQWLPRGFLDFKSL